MLLVVGNLWAYCGQATPTEAAWLLDFLKLPPRQFPRGQSLLSLAPGDIRFYAGLVSLVARSSPTPVSVRRFGTPKLTLNRAPLGWLFDYQLEAVEAVDRHRRGIIEIPTGGGKGEIMLALPLGYGGHWGVLSPSRDLMYQAAQRWERRSGQKAGICGDGVWKPDPLMRFTSCTYATLAENIGERKVRALLDSFDAVFADEAHTAPSNTCGKVLVGTETKAGRVGGCANAEIFVGVSGTPFDRSDSRDVMTVAYLGERIYQVGQQLLVDKGVLAKADVTFVEVRQSLNIEDLETDSPIYNEVYNRLVVNSVERNKALVSATVARPGPRLVFVENVAHGHELHKAFRARGVVTEFVFGDDDREERLEVLNALASRTLDVAIATRMWRTGIDVPALMTVTNAAARKSVIELRQGIGRGIRRIDSNKRVIKDVFHVVDAYDRGNRYLEDAANTRMSTLRRLGYDVRVV